MNNYNLINEEWIPVLYLNGDFKKLGIRKVFEDAHQIRQIAASNPMDRVALFRFLLAVLYWCRGNPDPNNQILSSKFPKEWFAKLDEYKDCFNLLGDGKRFYQDVQFSNNKKASITYLYHEISADGGKNDPHNSVNNLSGLCPACCAVGLIRLPVYATAQGRGYYLGINNTPPIYVIPFGSSLAESLIFNFEVVENLGKPFWEGLNWSSQIESIIPFLKGLTVIPQGIWLENPGESSACINCGKMTRLIYEYVRVGVKLNFDKEYWSDPHVIHNDNESSAKAMEAENVDHKWFKTDKPWSKILQNMISNNRFKPFCYLIVGFSSNKAKYISSWERIIHIRSKQDTERLLNYLEKWDDSVKKIQWVLKFDRKKINSIENSIMREIRPHIEYKISTKLKDIYNDMPDLWNIGAKEYREAMNPVSQMLYPSANTSSIRNKLVLSELSPSEEKKSINKSKTKAKK